MNLYAPVAQVRVVRDSIQPYGAVRSSGNQGASGAGACIRPIPEANRVWGTFWPEVEPDMRIFIAILSPGRPTAAVLKETGHA